MQTIKIDDHSGDYLNRVDAALDKAMEDIGIHIEGEAKEEIENSPARLDTGLLRNSIAYAVDGEATNISTYSGDNPSKYGNKGIPSGSYSGNAPKENGGRSVIIGSNVEYALYVHEGTSKMTANRFLKNAVERNKDQIHKILEDALT